MHSTSRPTTPLSSSGRAAAGLTLLAMIGIELGGNYVLDISRGKLPATEFQTTFARTGHGHAGALATLGLAGSLLAEHTALPGPARQFARWSIPAASVLMPAGFFLSSMGKDRTEPNRLMGLVYVGAGVLAAGLGTLGVGLLAAARR